MFLMEVREETERGEKGEGEELFTTTNVCPAVYYLR